MKILFDTNIVLDVLLDRTPHADYSAKLFSEVENGNIEGYLCATTITTISYLLEKAVSVTESSKHIQSLLDLFEIAVVNRVVLENALRCGFDDFEDAVIHEAAVHSCAQHIVTRDTQGFKRSNLPVHTPQEFYAILQSLER